MIEEVKGYKLKPGDIVYDINPKTYFATRFRVDDVDPFTDSLQLTRLSGNNGYLSNESGFTFFSTKGVWYKETPSITPIKKMKEFKL